MVQSLKLGSPEAEAGRGIRRLNRLPIIVAIALVIVFFAVISYGLTSRGLYFRREAGIDNASSNPASTYADQLKKGVSNGIIGDQQETQSIPTGTGAARIPEAGKQSLHRPAAGGAGWLATRVGTAVAGAS